MKTELSFTLLALEFRKKLFGKREWIFEMKPVASASFVPSFADLWRFFASACRRGSKSLWYQSDPHVHNRASKEIPSSELTSVVYLVSSTVCSSACNLKPFPVSSGTSRFFYQQLLFILFCKSLSTKIKFASCWACKMSSAPAFSSSA